MEEEIKKMYSLKPGEKMGFYYYDVIRVPGGWAFSCSAGVGFFVPYDNDLQRCLKSTKEKL